MRLFAGIILGFAISGCASAIAVQSKKPELKKSEVKVEHAEMVQVQNCKPSSVVKGKVSFLCEKVKK